LSHWLSFVKKVIDIFKEFDIDISKLLT